MDDNFRDRLRSGSYMLSRTLAPAPVYDGFRRCSQLADDALRRSCSRASANDISRRANRSLDKDEMNRSYYRDNNDYQKGANLSQTVASGPVHKVSRHYYQDSYHTRGTAMGILLSLIHI